MAAKESKVCDETHQVLEKQFKCDVCGIGPRPEKMSWYKCLDGHAICQDCRKFNCLNRELIVEWVENDPSIPSRISFPCPVKLEEPVYNEYEDEYESYCYESILPEPCKMITALLSTKNMRFTCKGCKKLLEKEAMISHEPECIQNYRIVACPIEHKPMLKMPFHQVLDHLKGHQNVLSKLPLKSVDFRKLSFDEKLVQEIDFSPGAHYTTMWLNYASAMFEIDGKTFIHSMRQIKRNRDRAHIYQWIHFVGSPNEAKNYAYTLEYYGNDDRTSTYFGQVIPIDEDYDSIITNFNGFKCFSIDFYAFKTQFIHGDKIKYSIRINNLKEEIKDENANPETEERTKQGEVKVKKKR